MYRFFLKLLSARYHHQVPATGVGLFRLLFGLVTFQETLFLLYFNHLIFDPVPYLDVEFPMVATFTCLWSVVALAVTLGYRCQPAIIANYVFWLIFVNFTPMQRDFDGGFDAFMTGTNFFLIFMPIDKAFSLDALRRKLSRPFVHYSGYPKEQVFELAYYLPVVVCLGFMYFDSAIHKLFAEHWRNGLGAWLPTTQPYYVSALNMSWLLNHEMLEKAIGYAIIVFQLTFVFLFHVRRLRPLYFCFGVALHLGITLFLNIYPFGLGMLIFYVLVAPSSWYRAVSRLLTAKTPALTVFYDENCPLCNRTVLIINHFDVFRRVDFKGAQSHAYEFPQLAGIGQNRLMTDLYALDRLGGIHSGLDTYIQILMKTGYLYWAGLMLRLPGVYWMASRYYRKIADSRQRIQCDDTCHDGQPYRGVMFYDLYLAADEAKAAKRICHRLTRFFLLLLILQLNSTVHYGLVYRLGIETDRSPVTRTLSDISNTLIMVSQTLWGITPHALYLHDHFAGYNHIIALTYLDRQGHEQWLPFVNQQGRLVAPNWGRVHSMWANIAVTPDIDEQRLAKFIMKVTAFWGTKAALNLDETTFLIKLKSIESPFTWRQGLLNENLKGQWKTIGYARWNGKRIRVQLPMNIDPD